MRRKIRTSTTSTRYHGKVKVSNDYSLLVPLENNRVDSGPDPVLSGLGPESDKRERVSLPDLGASASYGNLLVRRVALLCACCSSPQSSAAWRGVVFCRGDLLA